MRTDRIDLVQVHMSPSRDTLEQQDLLGTLRALQQQGKLRFIGMSEELIGVFAHTSPPSKGIWAARSMNSFRLGAYAYQVQ